MIRIRDDFIYKHYLHRILLSAIGVCVVIFGRFLPSYRGYDLSYVFSSNEIRLFLVETPPFSDTYTLYYNCKLADWFCKWRSVFRRNLNYKFSKNIFSLQIGRHFSLTSDQISSVGIFPLGFYHDFDLKLIADNFYAIYSLFHKF